MSKLVSRGLLTRWISYRFLALVTLELVTR